ncbi:MAG TPA: 5'-nucleotidase, lipoprotein e(P4) family [Verrucomicrobiota bacterium]|nr:5'-nucleotidase, lipoprotein e(P4) family [Verrucomicrobiota bacterium]
MKIMIYLTHRVRWLGAACAAMIVVSCSTVHRPASAPGDTANKPGSELTYALLWYKYAAEARALYYQAYNAARDRLAMAIAQHANGQDRLAVILDIDETVLDNTPVQNQLANGEVFSPEMWKAWSDKASADALPGAREFLCYAASNGVEVFYVSNRKTNELAATIRNLALRNFPMTDPDHVLLQEANESKVPRRSAASANHTVVLLIGDNLNDLSEIFENVSVGERFRLTDDRREEFGRRFIVLPNPMYGDWENALYDYYRLSPSEKAAIRRRLIQP